MNIIFKMFKNLFRSKIDTFLYVCFLSSMICSYYLGIKYFEIKRDRNRIYENFKNKEQTITELRDKNGTLHSMVTGLTLKTNEFKEMNNGLTAELKNMNIKLKRAESVTRTVVKYQFKTDTIYTSIPTIIHDSTVYITTINNKWINSSWKSTISADSKKLYVSDYSVSLNDSLILVTETKYKGWWIFRKPVGVKLHVKSKNPYSKFERIEYIKLTKK